MKNLGVKEIGNIIERRHEMAIFLGDEINKSSDFVLLNDININSVVFMYVGNKNDIKYSIDELNSINKQIKEVIDNEKIYYLHQFSIPDNLGVLKKDTIVYPLRYMSGNDNIQKSDIIKMLSYVRKKAEEIVNKMK